MSAIPWIPGMFRHVLTPPGMGQNTPADSRKQWYINDHCVFVDAADRLHWFGTLFAHAAELFDWRGQTYITHCGIEDRHWSDIGAPYGLWLATLDWAERKQNDG